MELFRSSCHARTEGSRESRDLRNLSLLGQCLECVPLKSWGRMCAWKTYDISTIIECATHQRDATMHVRHFKPRGIRAFANDVLMIVMPYSRGGQRRAPEPHLRPSSHKRWIEKADYNRFLPFTWTCCTNSKAIIFPLPTWEKKITSKLLQQVQLKETNLYNVTLRNSKGGKMPYCVSRSLIF